MNDRTRKLLEDGRFANEYAEIIADELNVKEVSHTVGKDDKGRTIEVKYIHDTIGQDHTPLDIYIDGEPQNKQELAQALFNKFALAREGKK